MKKLIAVALVASFAGAIIAQQAPPQTVPARHVDKDKKDKKKHHHYHPHEHKPTDKK